MKYFLCTVNAKFIFIAGREMYDMYLADIADRSSYFGSIFDDVIFVPSLLSDDHKHITALPEEFVCRHLIPEDYPTDKWNLKMYRRYLDIHFGIDVMDKKKSKLQKKMENLRNKSYLNVTLLKVIEKLQKKRENLENKNCLYAILLKPIEYLLEKKLKIDRTLSNCLNALLRPIENLLKKIKLNMDRIINKLLNKIENLKNENCLYAILLKPIENLLKKILKMEKISKLQKERKIWQKLKEQEKLIEFREKEANRKIQKIIATLQHFIIYLSHTSKGAPKKMVQVFESFIVFLDSVKKIYVVIFSIFAFIFLFVDKRQDPHYTCGNRIK
jgi:hypothetical protein